VLYRELSKASEIATNTTENSSPEKEGGVENKDKICERIDHKINMRIIDQKVLKILKKLVEEMLKMKLINFLQDMLIR